MMDLAEHGPDTFVGTGPRYPWEGLYGGQIVAQSLRAAAATVDPAYRVHSLHAYFIRRGDSGQPTRFEVDRLRNGRSYVTRAVVARQPAGAIFNLAASFQVRREDRRPEDVGQIQTASRPRVPPPDELADDSWSPLFERRSISEKGGRAQAWLRIAEPGAGPDGDADPALAACALAFLSDDLPTEAVRSQRQSADGGILERGWRWQGISLDHAIWFQGPLEAGSWQLYDFRCDGLQPPRGLSVGHVFGDDGVHLATVTQEVLLRPVPDDS